MSGFTIGLTPEQQNGRNDTDGESDTGVDDEVSDLCQRGGVSSAAQLISVLTIRRDTDTCVELRKPRPNSCQLV